MSALNCATPIYYTNKCSDSQGKKIGEAWDWDSNMVRTDRKRRKKIGIGLGAGWNRLRL